MIYERWPDVDEPAYVTPEDYWPEADPGQAPVNFDDLVKAVEGAWGVTAAGFRAAVAPLVRSFTYMPKGKANAFREAIERGGATFAVYDEFTLVRSTDEMKEIADGYKTLNNGRKMPILPHNTGPRRDPFKNRGMTG